MKFVWPPLTNLMDERAKRIADGLAAAERGKQDLEQASKRVDEQIRLAKQQASELVLMAEKRAAQIVDEAKQAAKTESEKILVDARAQIGQEVLRAKEDLRGQVADLAVVGAEKIL
ncbi:F0F1 ATP synthase subunit B, partial [Staphylococcus aureus]|nr:F0F1 ATP synthase subunit B [Staphylococcus aureus]